MSDNDTTEITESIRALLAYNRGEQALAALKYGIVPFIGYVLKDPNKKNLSLLLNLLDAFGEIYLALGIDVPDVSKKIMEELKERAKEIETGVVKEPEGIDKGFIITTKEEKTDG